VCFTDDSLGATYPAQAILFSRVTQAFQLPPDQGIAQGDFYALMYFIVALGNLAVFATVGWVSNIVAQNVSRRYRREIFDLVLRQDMAFFDDEGNASGALAANLSTYPTNMLELLGFNLMLICINVVNVVSSSILAIAIGWKLGLAVVCGGMFPIVLAGYARIRLEFKLEEDTGKRFASSAALASEAVSAIRTVSSLALERHILAKYQDKLSGVASKSTKALVWTMFWYSLSQSISFLSMALGFWVRLHIKLLEKVLNVSVWRNLDQQPRVHHIAVFYCIYQRHLLRRSRGRFLCLHHEPYQICYRSKLRLLAPQVEASGSRGLVKATIRRRKRRQRSCTHRSAGYLVCIRIETAC
jgi:ABC-type multidrug transport system fused ATPase/permease subunit